MSLFQWENKFKNIHTFIHVQYEEKNAVRLPTSINILTTILSSSLDYRFSSFKKLLKNLMEIFSSNQ